MMQRYCICRKTQSDSYMVGCDNCDEWFHVKCINLSRKQVKNIDKYYCEQCRKTDGLEIVYKSGHVVNGSIAKDSKEPSIVKQESFGERKHEPLEERKHELSDERKQEPLEEKKQEKKVLERVQITPAIRHKSQSDNISPQKAVMGKRKVSAKAKSKFHPRKQCANPECVYESRQESKYCSEECGLAFNTLRYEKYYLPKLDSLKLNPSKAKSERLQYRDQLEKEKKQAEDLIKNLREEKEELESSIKKIKEDAKRMRKEQTSPRMKDDDEPSSKLEDGDETLTGDSAKTFCITCSHFIVKNQALKHWSSCYKKHEADFDCTAQHEWKVPNDLKECDPEAKIYCNTQDKKSKRYCRHLESACPQHSNWQIHKDEVCGCPLDIKQKVEADGKYCLELKKDCNLHYHWDKFRLAHMNMQRAQAFSKWDAIQDKIKTTMDNLRNVHGGVVGVMLHNTIDHVKGDMNDPLGNIQDTDMIDVTQC